MKLNVLLALREKLGKRYAAMIGDYTNFFKNKQGAFQGTLKTHSPLDGYAVDATKVANIRVITTVNEKMDWWLREALEYINTALTIEASNGEGAPTVPLVFEGKEYYTVGDVDAYLTNLYGDYMTLPPDKSRNASHLEIFEEILIFLFCR